MSWTLTESDAILVRDRIAIQTESGRYPLLIASDDVVSGLVVYGYLAGEPSLQWAKAPTLCRYEMTIEEEPRAIW
jgi:hypothetical protein